MLKSILLFIVFSFWSVFGLSQHSILENGRIIYERKINAYAIISDFVKGSDLVTSDAFSSFLQRYRQDHPQFWVDSFQLFFNTDSTLYQPVGSVSPFLHGTGVPMAEKNRVFNRLSSFQYIAQKNAYSEQRLIRDTLVKIQWKLTDETREIAGFECRRANGLIQDSIYLVAFYADAIKTKGGPERFHGLPGMILGLAIPHYHITYFATRIEPIIIQLDKQYSSLFEKQEKSILQSDYFNEMVGYLKEKKLDNAWMKVFLSL
ncbi:MAG: GLPGLI family protein [Sediminibacterium sp.]